MCCGWAICFCAGCGQLRLMEQCGGMIVLPFPLHHEFVDIPVIGTS